MYSEKSYLFTSPHSRYDNELNSRASRGSSQNRLRMFHCSSCILILCAVSVLIIVMLEYSVENEETVDDLNAENSSLTSTHLLKAGFDGLNNKITSDEKETALNWGLEQLKLKNAYDYINPKVATGSAIHKHQQSIATYNSALELTKKGYIISKASQKLFARHPDLTKNEENIALPNYSPSIDVKFCNDYVKSKCNLVAYRTIDGSCNNLKNPQIWGTAMRPFARLLKPDYCDGIFTPRCGLNGMDLPSARLVSVKLHRPDYEHDSRFNVMLAVWGQFIDHDISATALTRGNNGEFLSCCNSPADNMHPECFPVFIPKDDVYYHDKNKTCMDFIRSASAPTCTFSPREQLNQVSSFLDGSAIYGNTEELASTLRSYNDGRLKMLHLDDGTELLPISSDPGDGCNRLDQIKDGKYCFLSGDARANENLHLTTMHLIMARHHNFVAAKLKNINKNWNDEKLYQESRKIISAQVQHITYNEFLEPLLGSDTMKKYDLNSLSSGFYKKYNGSLDPSVSNVFAAAAFRFAHTLLPGLIMNIDRSVNSTEYTELHSMLFNPFNLYKSGKLDYLLEGAMDTNVEKYNRYFSKEVTENLFGNDEKPVPGEEKLEKSCGLDLVSLNIQRGRDHGLPAYIFWRKKCNLSPVKTFEDLDGIMDHETIKIFKMIYENVEDIDLYSGAVSEIPIKDGMLGPMATCIIADQFQRLKAGDRFWYENDQIPQSFTIDQLQEIRKTTLAKIICDNADNITVIAEEVMKIGSQENKHINCESIPEMDFNLWRDMDAKENTLCDSSLGKGEKLCKKPLIKASDNIIKEYFSATITNCKIFIKSDTNTTVTPFSTGVLPIYLPLENILNPKTFGDQIKINFTANLVSNFTVTGNFKIPKYEITPKFLEGDFELDFIYKYGGNIDYILPNHEYNCKILLISNIKAILMKTNDLNNGEVCTIMLTGSYAQPSFICSLFSVFCSYENIFKWSGDIELTLRKTLPPNPLLNINNNLNLKNNIYFGKISNGYLKFKNKFITISTNMLIKKFINIVDYNNNKTLNVNIFGREIRWSCQHFHRTISGTFQIPIYSDKVVNSFHNGTFYINIDSNLNLDFLKFILPKITYKTYFHFNNNNDFKLMDYNNNWSNQENLEIENKVILFGNRVNHVGDFIWNGHFLIIFKNGPKIW